MVNQKPFSTMLVLTIIKLTDERDTNLAAAFREFKESGDREAYEKAKESIAADWHSAIFGACENTFATLEATVSSVLAIQEQMMVVRNNMAAEI